MVLVVEKPLRVLQHDLFDVCGHRETRGVLEAQHGVPPPAEIVPRKEEHVIDAVVLVHPQPEVGQLVMLGREDAGEVLSREVHGLFQVRLRAWQVLRDKTRHKRLAKRKDNQCENGIPGHGVLESWWRESVEVTRVDK